MAKAKGKRSAHALSGPVEYKPPTPNERMRMRAEDAAHSLVMEHPMVKKLHKEMTDRIHGAMKAGMKSPMMSGGGTRKVRST